MPSSFRTPKTLSEWLKPDLFRRETGLRRLKGVLVVAALLLSLAGVAATLTLPRGRTAFQAGPVSRAHATFGDRCEECHTHPFQTAGRFLGSGDRPTVSDDACTRCHGDHPHHAAAEARPGHCAACHREHRSHSELVQVADGHCTGCHADLRASVKDGVSVRFKDVPDFAGHPEFALWRDDTQTKDPGRINFSHHDHLVPLTAPGKDGGARVSRQLGCGDCHQPDAGGLAMQPVRFDKHCAECHPVFAPFKDEGPNEATRRAVETFRKTPLPHPGPGQSAETVRGVLRDRLTRLAQEHPALVTGRGAAEPERPIPGGRRAPPVNEEVFRWVDQRLGEAERVLFDRKAGCVLCHRELDEPQRTNGLPALALANLPERWLSHSAFSHRSHQAYECAKCHKGAGESQDACDVLMPRLSDCRGCHNREMGARSDCVGCHAYHKPEERLKGLRTLEECRKYAAENPLAPDECPRK
jgi:hypothetical protein